MVRRPPRSTRWTHSFPTRRSSDYYASWIKFAPQDAARIFGAQLGRWFRLNPEGHPFKRRYEDGGSAMHWLSELTKAAPLALLEQLLPFMCLAMKRDRKSVV